MFHSRTNNYPNNNSLFLLNKVTNLCHDFKMNIKSYFKVLTEDDIEQHELKAKQVFRKEQRLTEQVESVVGRKVESELVAVVERYNSHGVRR